MAGKKATKGKRYTPAERKHILSTAAREELTGAQVAKRFGVSTLSFYRWRGPVRRGRQSGTPSVGSASPGLAEQVRATVRDVLPGIIRREVQAYLDAALGRRPPGRPRKT